MRASRQMRRTSSVTGWSSSCFDVLLQQGPADVGGINAKPGRFTPPRPQPAQFRPQNVVAGRVDLQIADIQGAVIGDDVGPHLVQQSACGQLALQLLGDAQLACRPANRFARRLRTDRQRLGENRLGRRQIFFDVGWRKRQHRADPLETLPIGILGQAGRIGHDERHAQQVADRVAIFLARQPAKRHPLAQGRLPGRLRLGQFAGNPLRHAGHLLVVGTRLFVGGHLARVQPVHDLGPPSGRPLGGELALERVEPQIPLLLFRPVALQAMGREKGLDLARKIVAGRTPVRQQHQAAQQRRHAAAQRGRVCVQYSSVIGGGCPRDRLAMLRLVGWEGLSGRLGCRPANPQHWPMYYPTACRPTQANRRLIGDAPAGPVLPSKSLLADRFVPQLAPLDRCKAKAGLKPHGDCPRFAQSSEQIGTVPLPPAGPKAR